MRDEILWLLAVLLTVPGVMGAEVVAPDVKIAGDLNDEMLPRLAYNPDRDEYLAVWMQGYPLSEIRARSLNRYGLPVAQAFTVASGGYSRSNPDVAYDGVNQQFLVAYQYDFNGNVSDFDIRGRRVSGDGTPLGDEFWIEGSSWSQGSAELAFSSTSQEFLVVWSQGSGPGGNREVWARYVSSDGSVGERFMIASHTTESRMRPAVAWEATTNRFLVAYDNVNEIFGRLVVLTWVGNEFAIADLPAAASWPEVASCNNSQFLMIWQQYVSATDNRDIHGRMVDADGNQGSPLAIIETWEDESRSAVACLHDGSDDYLVVATTIMYGWVVGRRVTSTQAMGDSFIISASTAFLEVDVAGGGAGWLTAWDDDRTQPTTDLDVFGSAVWRLFADGFEWGSTANWSSTAP